MLGVWLRVAALALLLTLAAADRTLALWAGVLASAALLANAMVSAALGRLAVSMALSSRGAFAGESVEVRVRVTNRSAVLPLPWLRYAVALPRRLDRRAPSWLGSLLPGETVETAFALPLPTRGVYRIGRVALEVGDWFALWRKAGTVDVPLWLTVYPRPVPTLPPPPPRLPAGERRLPNSPFRDLEPAGLREYRRGDPPRTIAWKASARHGTLIVREFPPVRDRANLLLLDMRPSVWPQPHPEAWIERAVAFSAAWVVRTAERGEAVGLHAWGLPVRFEPPEGGGLGQAAEAAAPAARAAGLPLGVGTDTAPPWTEWAAADASPRAGRVFALPVRQGAEQRRRVLDALALLHPAEGPPFAHGALAALRRLGARSSVVWLAGRAEADTLAGAAAAALAGHAVALVVAGLGAAAAAAPASGVTVWPLPVGDEPA